MYIYNRHAQSSNTGVGMRLEIEAYSRHTATTGQRIQLKTHLRQEVS